MSAVLLKSVPDVFFVEDQSERASKAGKVSQPVQACKPGLGDLSKPTAPAYLFGINLMFFGVMKFDQV